MNSRKFQRIAVVMGGPSTEREVSLKSGSAIADALEAAGYVVHRFELTEAALPDLGDAEAVFVAIHGAYGEDGGIQADLEARGIPYIGTRAADMPTSMDKVLTRDVLAEADLPVPPGQVLPPGLDESIIAAPCVVKAPNQGSSIGISVVREGPEFDADFAAAVELSRSFEPTVLVEQFIDGREFTVGLLGADDDSLQPLPVVEICAPNGTYDFDAKYEYKNGRTEYKVPAPIPDALAAECQRLAVAAMCAVGGRHLGRVDFRVDQQNRPYILEFNSIPGFTATSLLPKAAAEAGIPFPELCSRIIEMAE